MSHGWRHGIIRCQEEAYPRVVEFIRGVLWGRKHPRDFAIATHQGEAHIHVIYYENTRKTDKNLAGRLMGSSGFEGYKSRGLYCYECALRYFREGPRQLEESYATDNPDYPRCPSCQNAMLRSGEWELIEFV